MEGITWIRLGTIAALFLGSVYVLLPTALQGDLEAQRAAAAAAIETPDSGRKSLEVLFETTDATAAAPVLRARLKAAGLAIERVRVKDHMVAVTPGAGTTKESIIAVASHAGVAKIHDPNVVSPVPPVTPTAPAEPPAPEPLWAALREADAANLGWWGENLDDWYGAPVPPGAGDLGLSVKGLAGSEITLSGALPDSVPFGIVSVDSKMVGLVFSAGSGARFEPLATKVETSTGAEWLADEESIGLLVSGSLPGPLAVHGKDEGPKDGAGPAAQVAESSVPAWLLDLLPDTAINLGLDLQGGLDITLQVELDDAVMSQVARDAASFKELAERNNVEVASIRKDKIEPIIWFEVPDERLDEVQSFLYENNRDYVYARKSEDGRHGFKMADGRIDRVKTEAVEQVLETLRKRVDATGVKEPSIVKKGGGRINVQLPGAVDLQEAIEAIGTTAILEFRMVDPKFDQAVLGDIIGAAEDALTPEQFEDDDFVNGWLWQTKRLEEDRIVLWHYEETTEGMQRITYRRGDNEGPLVLMNEVVLTGNDVNDASVGYDQNNFPYVGLSFKPRGSQIFCDITTKHVKERFAIILDHQIRSAPSIRERICGGRASIEMGSSMDAVGDAQTLALVLRTGSLDAPVSIGEVRQVGAQLGHDSIRSGSIASVAGGIVVVLFMGIWYRRAGMLANIALALNVLLVIAALALFGATLTLPGIAGIALTVGMAVDANIIIFERIREELALGVHPRKAVDVGFDKGLVAVLDANITTAIAGIVLFSYGTGPIKGFAVTLLIGIVTTLITALFVTRTLMELVTRSSSARITI
ncbi:MAG: protein translocase subunit SecD [Alphaproteobacteria bacterium]|nr:protein translocase subunit SecD [Alphaproteobacteria bacterium]